jgi:hypothetical protein
MPRAKGSGHIIGDIRYSPGNGPSWLVCDKDGTRFDAPTPDALAKLWVAHGGKADHDAVIRKPECGHPLRKHYGLGMCVLCYHKSRNATDKRPHRKSTVAA